MCGVAILAFQACLHKIMAEYAKPCDFCLKAGQARGKHEVSYAGLA